jgi:NAD(P)-dependent dehydrogenase (short-subunit alcohol dehydrogenase family)
MESLRGKVALVTGGAQGLGLATAEKLATSGCKVVIADLQEEKGEASCAAIAEAGGEASFVSVDVTSASAVAAMVQTVLNRHGRLDCAVNNAGAEGEIATTDLYSEERWNQVIGINLTGVFLCMKEQLKVMREQQSGAVVNMASICGLTGMANFSAYNASKHGVVGLTKTAALEFATEGVRVNAVGPGFARTAMITDRGLEAKPGSEVYQEIEALHPMNRMAEPTEIAEAVAWLCSDSASFVTGHTLVADGGFMAQ